MADKKISELTASTTPLAGTEQLAIVQSGDTKKTSVESILSSVRPSGVAEGVLYLNGSKVAVSNSGMLFNGKQLILNYQPNSGTRNLLISGPDNANGIQIQTTSPSANYVSLVSFSGGDGSGGQKSLGSIGAYQATNSSSGQLRFFTADNGVNTAKLNIDAVGNTSIYLGNLVIGTSGKGIDFSADGQAAGMTSELLDDYEEGTFTPTVVGTTTAGTGTYNARTGVYTKVGDTVFFQLWINMSAHTGTGNFRITGLPFVSANIAGVVNAYSGAVGYCTGLAIPADGTVIWYVGQGVSQTDLYRNSISTAVSSAALPLDPASQVQITGWYKAA